MHSDSCLWSCSTNSACPWIKTFAGFLCQQAWFVLWNMGASKMIVSFSLESFSTEPWVHWVLLLQFLRYSYNRYRDETHMISICKIIYMHESHQLDQKFESRAVPISCNIHGTIDIRFLRGFRVFLGRWKWSMMLSAWWCSAPTNQSIVMGNRDVEDWTHFAPSLPLPLYAPHIAKLKVWSIPLCAGSDPFKRPTLNVFTLTTDHWS